jgi:hypothetical protein
MIKIKRQIEKVLGQEDIKIIKNLNTPHKVQNFLDQIPFDFEEEGESYHSPKIVIKKNKAHCFEGALFAHLCLTYTGFTNYILDLKVKKTAIKYDSDHTLCVFKINGYWGAISKTNHSVLRWRDPIYENISELAKSYYHEYFFDDTGEKTLESYSKPFNVFGKFGVGWVGADFDLDRIALALDRYTHNPFVPKINKKFIRLAGKTEIKGASVTQWNKK